MEKYGCIDIGGTDIKYGVVDETGNLLFKKTTPSKAASGAEVMAENVCHIVEEMIREYRIDGVSISTPGVVDAATGEILVCGPNIPGYTGMSLKKILEERYPIIVEVENDVNCAAMAEACAGAGKGSNHVFVMTIGTGIGGSYVVNGQILQGARGAACEVGFLPFKDSFFEFHGSASALSRHVAKRKNEEPEKWNGRQIFESAKQRDEICQEEIDRTCQILGEGLSMIATVLNPEVIVLGGGILARHDLLLPKIQAVMKEKMLPFSYECLSLKPAQFQNDAGIMGAFYNFTSKHPN